MNNKKYNTSKENNLRHYLTQFGSGSMSYSTLQQELDHFLLDGIGYIAYLPFKHPIWSLKGHRIVIGNPICDPSNYQHILSQFLQQTDRVIFVHIDDKCGNALTALGIQVNGFGIETELLCKHFDLAGKARAKLRQWRNKCIREGVIITEKNVNDFKDKSSIKEISNAWLSKKGTREYGILSRPFSYEKEPDVRNFWAYQNNKMIAMAVFDPIYNHGEVIGYYHNVDRIVPEAPNGTGAYLILEALKVFEQEGLKFISLGMSPLFMIKSHPNHQKNQQTQQILKYAYKNLNEIYPFKGNASHKQKFAGKTKQAYIAATKGNNLWEVLILLKALGALELNMDTLKIFSHIALKSVTLIRGLK